MPYSALLTIAGALLAIPVLVVAVGWLNKSEKRAKEIKAHNEYLAAQKAKAAAEAAHKEEIKRKERELVERYTNSELTRKVIAVLCKGNPETYLPEKIWIYHDKIVGELKGEIRTFDFGINRVHNFKQVFCSGELGEDFDNRFAEMEKQQMAMATALNNLLKGKYKIFDLPSDRIEERTFSDGETYLWQIYQSDHILMQLRSTLPNQSF